MEAIIPVFRRSLFCIFFLATGHFLGAQVLVKHIDHPDDIQGRKGVVYALPRTVITVDVLVEAKYSYRGPYAGQAESVLGITDYIKRSQEEYRIATVTIGTYAEPDPGQYYFVQMEEKSDKGFELQLGPSGVITASRPVSRENPAGGAARELTEVFPYYKPSAVKVETDTIRRILSVEDVTIQKYLLRNTLVRQSEEEMAREAADMINVLKQDKYNILIGYQETAYELGAMKYMVDRLESMEKEYLKLFAGATESESFNLTFLFIPGSGDDETLFLFSEEGGVNASGGSPVKIAVEDMGLTELLPDQSGAEGRTGLFYRIPGTAEVTVEYNGKSLQKERMVINQLGKVLSLPSATTQVSIDPVTGNLRRAVLQSP